MFIQTIADSGLNRAINSGLLGSKLLITGVPYLFVCLFAKHKAVLLLAFSLPHRQESPVTIPVDGKRFSLGCDGTNLNRDRLQLHPGAAV